MRLLLVATSLAASLSAQLGPAPVPPGNPTTPEKVVLGKMLFWEEQLSSDDSMACGTCHAPEYGGADGRSARWHPGLDGVLGTNDDARGSTSLVRLDENGDFKRSELFGFRPQATRRVAPSVLGAGHHKLLNWDGAVEDRLVDPENGAVVLATGAALERQALLPILDPNEMAREGRTWRDVRVKLQRVEPLHLARNLTPDIQAALQLYPSYPKLFEAAFGDDRISAVRIAMALASYQRTLNPDETPWDRFIAGNPNAMTSLEKIGWNLFRTSGRCVSCHATPLFSDSGFYNLGLRPAAADPGLGKLVRSLPAQGAFRTPSLRNAGLRPRLFHNGSSERLGDPTQFWAADSTLNAHWYGGGEHSQNVDPRLPNLRELGVSQNEVALMLEFVRTALVDPRARDAVPPFDHPTLRSSAESPPRLFGESLPGATEPFLVDWMPPYPGNAGFRLGLVGSSPGSLALLGIGFQSYEPTVWYQGLPYSMLPHALQPFVLGGEPGLPGHTTWRIPLVGFPDLSNVPLYYQLWVIDPTAPGGTASSQATEFFIR